MIMNELDTVVLECDMVDKGLERGDIGTIVQRYSADALGIGRIW